MRPLYVETLIRADPASVWHHTQDPAQHARWDLRFTRITPEPGHAACPDSPAAGTRFRYATRVLPGLTIAGHGTTVGERRRPDGTGTSALRFASPHPLSPMRAGSGYWRYVPTAAGLRFLTGYDYTPGLGRAADRIARPLLGWATAWSFDRLRLWLETGASPRRLLARALAEAAARTAVTVLAARLTGSLLATVWVATTCLLVPPLPGTPAARRCLRRPPDRHAATAPETLERLETP
ncbi:hypothetical protein [Yinghuangia seranimata]|uniref:hypothetical protein n=1 Tax=Yinghuangia seranimata TaxID=408067 RepID=UPI00248BBE5C|nr:hypothetical protein [Yinghuangia seranimata]MDI2126479.1 hypothetical protein [Yinghuangia seranimata]